MKKVMIYTTVGVALIVLGVYSSSSVFAQESTSIPRFPFVTELAEKLNMDETELEVVVDEIQEAHRAEMVAERTEATLQAIEDGKLTERQAEILNAMEDLRPEGGRGMFGAGKDVSAEEREEFRAEREGSMLEALNEKGLDVTEEELQELRDVREELGLMGSQNRRGGNGGQGSGECPNL